ncbi:acetate/propionate family kinase [Mangrovimonas sp. YM274]|uniref:acetate/propionate family kinase n=1 Tax=Mangrovimonas sp. YM274 TaxID=3070660 RepID=UPI0027DD7F78|nr:acetate kinase [Mangrovimonas sp. YM274]WMI68081.1 acetate kinase [Mangrovimonas sp. YM274]
MKTLVINSGSSSIKFQLIEMPSETVVASGLVERIGLDVGAIVYKKGSEGITLNIPVADHAFGLSEVAKLLMDPKKGVIANVDEIDVVGHRIVHGGKDFSDTIEIDEKVKHKIKSLFSLAPLHNPPNYEGVLVAERIFPNAKQVAVFDTAFHQSLPQKVYKYAIENKYLDQGIRVYGFHGISHKFVSEEAVAFLKNPSAKIITIHLGNGCSMTAVHEGKSLDHTLGFGPNEGLIMGTRSGAIDQTVIFYLMNKYGYSKEEMSDILSKKSGMLGLTGFSDLREIEAEAGNGNKDCLLALEMNAYRIKKFIGAYAAAMNGLDAIVFTAGIGENSDVLRGLVCEDMDFLGIQLNTELNAIRSKDARDISTETSRVKVLVIPTNEELEIAKQSYELVTK